ncbi:hypothetical protein BCV69DRAFT_314405 [Microstroma glucosiphilum]|uniref:SEN1 N terminal-domain-containing protein n=1 Tax=Pseudomicrostroma glucosiphilum TaxID=1684307 RepID=A0A316U0A7_9BASI|nr:hypothetical protein BCV69DRAFT_314405 [Pseudomicrostroma glucosiphilum]PWN18846.1 hypothetical protein BCV69DRAFT_314405 [Pseudomicrostroma glucosiphilum]
MSGTASTSAAESSKAAASSAAASSSSSSSPLRREVYSLVARLRENPKDASPYSTLIPAAIDYIKATDTGAKQTHFFCPKDGAAEAELHTCMLRVLSFKTNDLIQDWLSRLAKHLYGCVECYKGFMLAKEDLRSSFLAGYSDGQIERFLSFLDEWEEGIALELWKSRKVGPGDGLGFLSPAELFASLTVAAVRDEIYKLFKQTMTPHKLATAMKPISPGVLRLAFDEDSKCRAWANVQLQEAPHPAPLPQEFCQTRPVRKLLAEAAKELSEGPFPQRAQQLWTALASIAYRCAPASLALMSDLVSRNLHDAGPSLPLILRVYDGVLKAQGPRLWGDDREQALVSLASVLDNAAFIQAIAAASEAELLDYTDWMRSFLTSVADEEGKDANGTANDSSARRQDTPPTTNTYGEVLKRLIHFLLERMQQGNTSSTSRRLVFDQGTSILLEAFESITDLASPAFTTISQVVGLYARPITNLVFRGQLPTSNERLSIERTSRQLAKNLILAIFEADQALVADSIRHLSEISHRQLSRWKNRQKPGHPSREDIYKIGLQEKYPSPSVCTELWSNAYQSFNGSASNPREVADTAGVFLKPLSKLILYGEPTLSTHLLPPPSSAPESSRYNEYKQAVKACIVAISRRLRVIRGELPILLTELSESDMSSSNHGGLQEQCLHLSAELVALNLSPVPELHKAAQNVIRAAYPDVESRADVFRVLLSASTASLHGVRSSLEFFVQACSELVEANDAAKWIVRSGADILDVLCNRTSGLLRPGAENSLVDRERQDKELLEEVVPSIWELMCRSIATIFHKTPKWSEHIAKEDMVAWFRDVTIFASQLTEEVGTMQRAANAKKRGERERRGAVITEEEEEMDNFILSCLALPLEQAISWLRINDTEIVGETLSYILKALDRFGGEVELPQKIADKILKFVKEQLDIDDPIQRKTVLSVGELLDLQARLDPSIKAITISDEEEDDVVLSKASSSMALSQRDSQSGWLSSMTSPTRSQQNLIAAKEKRRKMKQQKLSFPAKQVIDVDGLDDRDPPHGGSRAKDMAEALRGKQAQQPSVVDMLKTAKPAARPVTSASAGTSVNKYKSASASAVPKRAATAPSRSANPNMAALRKGFAAQPRSFPVNPNAVRRVPPTNANSMPEPKAPSASSTVTGAIAGHMSKGPSREESDDDTSSSDDDDDDEAAPKGLAALASATRSPTKGIKMVADPAPQPRRTKLLDDGGLDKARQERLEAERKRMLRTPPDLQALHLAILSWDWYHVSDVPPAAPGTAGIDHRPVPDKFANANEYAAVFGPLLMLEAWAQMQSAKDDFSRGVIPMYTCEVASRVSVDAFIDVGLTMSNTTPRSFRLGDADIVVLRQRHDAIEAGQQSGQDRVVLAKVEQFKNHPQGSQVTLRCALDNDKQGVASRLVNRSVWEVGSLFNLSTLHREFAALLTARYYDLVRDILQAKTTPRRRATPSEMRMMKDSYGVNEPQAEAILGALHSDGFTLVQGPPGTGKTKTICSLVAHFVATRKTPAPIAVGQGRTPVAPVTKKLLMCAPSNAAIDEVAKRAKLGFKGPDGRNVKVNVVRLGREDAMNEATKDVSLDALVEAALANSSGQGIDNSAFEQAQIELRSIRDERERKQLELEQAKASVNETLIKHLDLEIRALGSKRLTAAQKLDDARDKRQTASRKMDADRRRVRTEILLNADVICTTLSGAGHEALVSLPIDFETVVIDEAAQAVELSILIPLRYGCKRCIMVGDPRQLPPTVLSKKAVTLKYSQSLFVRLFEQAKDRVYLLGIQYRMHPEISTYPSQQFYGGRLIDGDGMAQLTAQTWHSDPLLKPYRFFSIRGFEQSSRGHSFINVEEAQIAVALYARLRRAAPGYNFDGKVGCVTMYKGQVEELKRRFAQSFGADIVQRVDFNTVDGFQGQEKEVIILSCVRSGQKGLGFLTDGRRINVAITRAKSNLFIVGDAEGLRNASTQDGLWRMLVDSGKARGVVQDASVDMLKSGINGRGAVVAPKPSGGRPRPAGWVQMEANCIRGPPATSTPASAPGTPVKRGADAIAGDRTTSSSPATKRARPNESVRPSAAVTSPARPTAASSPAQSVPIRPSPQASGLSAAPSPGPAGAAAPRPPPSRPPPAGINVDNLQTRRPGSGLGAPSGPAGMRGGMQARPPMRPPLRGPPRPSGPPGTGGGPRPPANGNGNGNGNGGASSGPSQAALDAVFVKKKKR